MTAPQGSRAAAHLLALCSFAVAQPLYDLLGRNPEFFAARGATRWQIVAFALLLALVPAAALVGLEAAVALVSARAARAVHLVLVAALVAVFVLEALRRASLPAALLLAVAGTVGAAVAAAYARVGALRSLLTVLAVAPLAFLALFALGSPVRRLILPEEASAGLSAVRARTPVVVLQLDELPTGSLMDARHRIDPVRFPHFAALARGADWYREATTIHDSTTFSVPSILTGRVPRPGRLPTFADYPRNLFTLLGASYDLHVFEDVTHLCPVRVCRAESSFGAQLGGMVEDASLVYLHAVLPDRLTRSLPSVSESWSGFLERGRDEPGRFERFLESIRSGPRPGLWYVHLLLPHSPWHYLPDGTEYQARYPIPSWGPDEVWSRDRAVVVQNWQRHLLQTAYVDSLLGRLVGRLKAAGLYDRALLVVLPDHGINFAPGEKRRPVWPHNLEDIAYVPLLVKYPQQTRGRVRDEHVQTIDVLPTIADVLGVGVPWHVDGRSLRGPGDGDEVTVRKVSGRVLSAPLRELDRRRYADLRRQLALFGSDEPASSLYGVGPFRGLLGRRVSGARVTGFHTRGSRPVQLWGRAPGARGVAVVARGHVVATAPVYDGEFWALAPRAGSFEVVALR
jgi:sulfatase-like protein